MSLATAILESEREGEVLILTVHHSEQLVRDVLAAGARGYLLKSDAARDLMAAVDSLRLHRPFFTSKVGRMVLEGFLTNNPVSQDSSATLSDRERQVVQRLSHLWVFVPQRVPA